VNDPLFSLHQKLLVITAHLTLFADVDLHLLLFYYFIIYFIPNCRLAGTAANEAAHGKVVRHSHFGVVCAGTLAHLSSTTLTR
jgi:hypothetical protein